MSTITTKDGAEIHSQKDEINEDLLAFIKA